MSWKETSSFPQVCESIAYGGMLEPINSSSLSVDVLSRRMVFSSQDEVVVGNDWIGDAGSRNKSAPSVDYSLNTFVKGIQKITALLIS